MLQPRLNHLDRGTHAGPCAGKPGGKPCRTTAGNWRWRVACGASQQKCQVKYGSLNDLAGCGSDLDSLTPNTPNLLTVRTFRTGATTSRSGGLALFFVERRSLALGGLVFCAAIMHQNGKRGRLLLPTSKFGYSDVTLTCASQETQPLPRSQRNSIV
jgi:hypothetical protein